MYSGFLRLSLLVLFCLFITPLFAQEQTEDPFGQIIEKPKKEEVIQDPFAGPEPTKAGPKQETENPFGPAKEPTKVDPPKQDESPFGPAKEPTKVDPTQQDESPFGPVKNADSNSNQQVEDPFAKQGDSESPFDTTQPESNPSTTTPQNEQTAAVQEQQLPAEETFEQKFWNYLKSNAYENWAPAPGQSSDFYVGESPHGAFLKMYLNRTAIGDSQGLPNGSIIVKENYDADRATLKAITVMYRSKAYNPDAGNWYWIKYNPDGSVATKSVEDGGAKIMGRAKACINCHSNAAGDDFTFFNDK